jgi:hypothetical protein
MTLGSTQPLTEMSTRNLPGCKGRPARQADLTAICEPIVYKIWEPRRLTTLWAFMACYRDSFTFLFCYHETVTKEGDLHIFDSKPVNTNHAFTSVTIETIPAPPTV